MLTFSRWLGHCSSPGMGNAGISCDCQFVLLLIGAYVPRLVSAFVVPGPISQANPQIDQQFRCDQL